MRSSRTEGFFSQANGLSPFQNLPGHPVQVGSHIFRSNPEHSETLPLQPVIALAVIQ